MIKKYIPIRYVFQTYLQPTQRFLVPELWTS